MKSPDFKYFEETELTQTDEPRPADVDDGFVLLTITGQNDRCVKYKVSRNKYEEVMNMIHKEMPLTSMVGYHMYARAPRSKGTDKPKVLSHTPKKFHPDQIRSIRNDGRQYSTIAKEYGCGTTAIERIKKRVTYKYVD